MNNTKITSLHFRKGSDSRVVNILEKLLFHFVTFLFCVSIDSAFQINLNQYLIYNSFIDKFRISNFFCEVAIVITKIRQKTSQLLFKKNVKSLLGEKLLKKLFIKTELLDLAHTVHLTGDRIINKQTKKFRTQIVIVYRHNTYMVLLYYRKRFFKCFADRSIYFHIPIFRKVQRQTLWRNQECMLIPKIPKFGENEEYNYIFSSLHLNNCVICYI